MADESEIFARSISQALGRGGHLGAVVIPVPNLGNAPPAFASDYNNVFTKTIDLTNARIMEEMEVTGNFIWVIDATNQASNAQIRFNDQRNTPFTASLGLALGGFSFNRIYVTHEAQAGHEITLIYGVQEPGTNLFIQNPSQIVSTVELVRPGVLNHGVVVIGAGAALILAANADRHEVILSIETAGRTVNFGAAGIGVTEGVEISTGQSVTLRTTAAIYGIASAAATGVRYLEISQ